jgi:hypothetical protein
MPNQIGNLLRKLPRDTEIVVLFKRISDERVIARPDCAALLCVVNERRRNSLSKRSKNARTAGRSGVFFEKGGSFFPDVFRRQAMAVIGIENEAVGFLGGLEGVA